METMEKIVDDVRTVWNALAEFFGKLLEPLREFQSEVSDAAEAVAEAINAEKTDAQKRASRYQWVRAGKQRIRSLLLDRRSRVYHCRNACQKYGEWNLNETARFATSQKLRSDE